jgi:hypothetical protein
MKTTIKLISVLGCIILASCEKNNQENLKLNPDIQILSLEATIKEVMAWDTTTLTVHATGNNISYSWEANHGDILGSGISVKYAAGQCCIGLNTITCRVFNEQGYAEDTIQIRVTPYMIKP